MWIHVIPMKMSRNVGHTCRITQFNVNFEGRVCPRFHLMSSRAKPNFQQTNSYFDLSIIRGNFIEQQLKSYTFYSQFLGTFKKTNKNIICVQFTYFLYNFTFQQNYKQRNNNFPPKAFSDHERNWDIVKLNMQLNRLTFFGTNKLT